MLAVAIGFMIQDVVADALGVEIARDDEEIGQIQTLGRVAVLLGGLVFGGLLAGWLAMRLGSRGVFACAMGLPVIVALSAVFIPRPRERAAAPAPRPDAAPLGVAGRGWCSWWASPTRPSAPRSRSAPCAGRRSSCSSSRPCW